MRTAKPDTAFLSPGLVWAAGRTKKMCERVRVRDAAQVGFKRRVVWYDDVCTKIVQIHKKNEHTLWMADGWTDDSRTG